MTWRQQCGASLLLLVVLAAHADAQSLRGRVLDPAHRPINGALIELRDSAGHPLHIVLTGPAGTFAIDAPAPGRYLYRVAGIGFQPHPLTTVAIPAAGLDLRDIVLVPMTLHLPDLIAVGRGKYCGKSSASDEVFGRVLESAHTALQIIEETIQQHTVGFQVARIHTQTIYGGYNNFELADTSIAPMASWPVQSIDPDTLRVVGFGRLLEPGDENTREYYGPDARVLFSDWFLESHCFTVDKPKKHSPNDTLHLRFAPARKTRLVDVGGELVLDAHNLALLQFSFTLRNLPNWMPDDAAGGDMQFSRLDSGLWITRNWAIWAPIGKIAGGSRHISVGGQVETYGWVARVFVGRDTIPLIP